MNNAAGRLGDRLFTLLEVARSEAKRYGRAEADPAALAIVLAERSSDAFDACFGQGAAAALKRNPNVPLAGSDEANTVAVLEACEDDNPETVIAQLKAAVPSMVDYLERLREDSETADARAGLESSPSAESVDSSASDTRHDDGAQDGVPQSVSRFATLVEPDTSIVARDDVVDELVALMSRKVPATPLVLGQSGSGRTSLLNALAARIQADGYEGPLAGTRVARVGVDVLLAYNSMEVLGRVFDALRAGWIVAVDDAEAALALGTRGVLGQLLLRMRAAVEDTEARLVLLMDGQYGSRLDANDQELFGELTEVKLDPLEGEHLRGIVDPTASTLAEYHGVEIDPHLALLAAAPPGLRERRAHPGLLFDRIDGACARAALRPDRAVTDDDLRSEVASDVAPPDPEALASALRERVKGQDQALDAVCRRLALTRARLDLRTERPDGVFLFVGPTGVGKTELARAICTEVVGSEAALIRLDMSEYAHDWAVSRLVGPMPGYVGSTEPETWLTTRIAREPHTVLLLDEIEKAHPVVWNTFLQVFDAGRLSDSRGTVADFSRVIIVMTSNMGAEAFTDRPLGFATGSEEPNDRRVREETAILATIRERMPPELVNRLDGIVVFHGLDEATIAEIAIAELERLAERLAERGYTVTFSDEVAAHLAESGYDRRYGARHLQRNVEQLLLQPLVGRVERNLRADVVDGEIVWQGVT